MNTNSLSIPLPVLPIEGDYVMLIARLRPAFPETINYAISAGYGGVRNLVVAYDALTDGCVLQHIVNAVYNIVESLFRDAEEVLSGDPFMGVTTEEEELGYTLGETSCAYTIEKSLDNWDWLIPVGIPGILDTEAESGPHYQNEAIRAWLATLD